MSDDERATSADSAVLGTRLVVVGPCASGKTTLVAALREAGVDASVCAQEHSEIPTLWNHTEPDLLVLLEVDLATIRARRSPTWPEQIFLEQQRRLENARASADVVIDGRTASVGESTAMVLDRINAR
jgi:dienelactone hydrolase